MDDERLERIGRRRVLRGLAGLGAVLLGCSRNGFAEDPRASSGEKVAALDCGHEAWRKVLPPARYAVLFEEDTERPFSSPLNDEKHTGTYVCAACALPLFDSKTKFDSGTGWPSFYAPIPGRLGTKRDFFLVYPRTEYHCIRCGGHQGHIFDDGPKPTGKRYCNNGLALEFVAGGRELPELRSCPA